MFLFLVWFDKRKIPCNQIRLWLFSFSIILSGNVPWRDMTHVKTRSPIVVYVSPHVEGGQSPFPSFSVPFLKNSFITLAPQISTSLPAYPDYFCFFIVLHSINVVIFIPKTVNTQSVFIMRMYVIRSNRRDLPNCLKSSAKVKHLLSNVFLFPSLRFNKPCSSLWNVNVISILYILYGPISMNVHPES